MSFLPLGNAYGDDYGATKRKTSYWRGSGIEAQRARMKKIAERFEARSAAARSMKHGIHAKAFASMAATARAEYTRMGTLKTLSGADMGDMVLGDMVLGNMGIPALPINPWLALGLGVGAGFLLKGMMKGK